MHSEAHSQCSLSKYAILLFYSLAGVAHNKKKMYIAITPRWTIFTWGVVALILAWVPFIAFYKGTIIRAHSKYSKILMREERERIEREKEILDGMG